MATADKRKRQKTGYQPVLISLYPTDVAWLAATVTRLKRKRRKTAKSELVRLGLSLLKRQSEAELLEQLRTLE
jgi:hypothetical protein